MAKLYTFSHISGHYILDGSFRVSEKISLDSLEFKRTFSIYDDVFSLNNHDFFQKILKFQEDENRKKQKLKINTDYTRILKALQSILAAESQKEIKDSFANMRLNAIKETKKNVRDSVHRDTLLIQTINAIDELNKSINLLSKRLREWYSLYLPEVSRKITDHEKFVKLILSKSKEELLSEFRITDSIGSDISDNDVTEILALSSQLVSLVSLKERYTLYIKDLVSVICPNASYHLSEMICARLISQAGSFEKLASYPASTVQLLGAEKALFRFLKDRSKRSPKYGIVYQHPMMSKIPAKDRGRFARVLGNYACIAFKIDYNSKKFEKEKVEIISKNLLTFLKKYSNNKNNDEFSDV